MGWTPAFGGRDFGRLNSPSWRGPGDLPLTLALYRCVSMSTPSDDMIASLACCIASIRGAGYTPDEDHAQKEQAEQAGRQRRNAYGRHVLSDLDVHLTDDVQIVV